MNTELSPNQAYKVFLHELLGNSPALFPKIHSALYPSLPLSSATIHEDMPASNQWNRCQEIDELICFVQECFPGSLRYEGSSNSSLMVVVSQPNPEDFQQKQLFFDQGSIGNLFDKMMAAIGLHRGDIYLTSCYKNATENEEFFPILEREIELVRPKIILSFGLVPFFHGNTDQIQSQRGIKLDYVSSHDFFQCPVLTSHHPSILLHQPQWKKEAWEDLKKVKLCLNS